MSRATFWKPLSQAFKESEGFTVHFYLSGIPEPLEASCTEPQDGCIRGEAIAHNREPVTIWMDSVIAYRIEES